MTGYGILQKICGTFCFAILFTLSVSARPVLQDEDIRLTLQLKDVKLEKAIESIKEQSPYLFFISIANLDQKVSISVKDATIQNVCSKLFTPLGIDYKINGHYIYLSVKPKAEPRTVTGTVTDQTGQPVPGVSVFVQGTTTGTTTDIDGRFSLSVPAERLGGRLEFNSLGYETVTLPIGDRSIFNVPLNEEAVSLEGTVVTALGIRRDQKALSYNVQEVRSDLLTTVKDANFMNSLSGKVAGVNINASSSGVGGASKVVLRGNKSISQSSNALYVIDGIPMYNFGGGGGTEFDSKGASESIADINPEDIESISVLTGAAAAALYGSEAANGAVMNHHEEGTIGKAEGHILQQHRVSQPVPPPGVPEPLRHGTERKDRQQRNLQLGTIHTRIRPLQLFTGRLFRDRAHLHQRLLGQRRDGQEPDIFLSGGGQLRRHHPEQQVRPLQLHLPQH